MQKMIPDNAWNAIKHLFDYQGKGRRITNPRKYLEGIYYVARNACLWKFLPPCFGHKSTVHGAFIRWSKQGVFQKIHAIFIQKYLNELSTPHF